MTSLLVEMNMLPYFGNDYRPLSNIGRDGSRRYCTLTPDVCRFIALALEQMQADCFK